MIKYELRYRDGSVHSEYDCHLIAERAYNSQYVSPPKMERLLTLWRKVVTSTNITPGLNDANYTPDDES